METSPQFLEIQAYLIKEIEQHRFNFMIKKTIVFITYLVIIIALFLNLFYDELQLSYKIITQSQLAAISNLVIIIHYLFNLESGAKWNKLKQRKLQSLHQKLKYEGYSIPEISRLIREEIEKLDTIKFEFDKSNFTGFFK